MGVLDVLLKIVAIVGCLHALAIVGIVGVERARSWRETVGRNLRRTWGVVVALAIVLVLNKLVRDAGVELSWLIGLNVTGAIYSIEGTLVAHVQSFATPTLTSFFSFMYVYGYVFLLTFPLVAYALYDDWRPLRVLLVAYAFNYVVGLLCYVLFVAYGPRNFMPELVESLLYVHWPDVQLLTSRVNRNTNVFPSLHASLSVTVALLANRYRPLYPQWLPVAGWLAVSISLATVYLGIHWLTDVLAGFVVAFAAVSVASRWVHGTESESDAAPSLDGVLGDR